MDVIAYVVALALVVGGPVIAFLMRSGRPLALAGAPPGLEAARAIGRSELRAWRRDGAVIGSIGGL
jgi:hypothetical protein